MQTRAGIPRGPLQTSDVMTRPVVTALPSATLEEIARLMIEHQIGSVVIVDPSDGERVIGIVTETDFEVSDEPIPFTFLRWPKIFEKRVWSESSLEEVYALARSRPVEAIMSAPAHTVEEDAEVWEAVSVMLKNGVKQLPVLRRGHLVGIIARHDLMKFMVTDSAGGTTPRRS